MTIRHSLLYHHAAKEIGHIAAQTESIITATAEIARSVDVMAGLDAQHNAISAQTAEATA